MTKLLNQVGWYDFSQTGLMQSNRAPKLDWHIDTLIPNSLALLYLFAGIFAGI